MKFITKNNIQNSFCHQGFSSVGASDKVQGALKNFRK
jgi:hypothetical protein